MRSVRSISPDFKDSNPEDVNKFDHKKFLSTLNKFDIKQNIEKKYKELQKTNDDFINKINEKQKEIQKWRNEIDEQKVRDSLENAQLIG